LAKAINSLTDFAGTDGCAAITYGAEATSETGARSFSISNGSLGNRLGFTTSGSELLSSV
jgi:hypothetical protein